MRQPHANTVLAAYKIRPTILSIEKYGIKVGLPFALYIILAFAQIYGLSLGWDHQRISYIVFVSFISWMH